MKKKPLELRMYFLVMYNISPIQQGIQALHAVIEFFLKHWKSKEFWRWARTHKTVIILNGGTSNDGTQSMYGADYAFGSMEQHLDNLKANKIKCAGFWEPDLNYSLSSIAFLVDERVFNKKDYPDFIFEKETLNSYSDPGEDNLNIEFEKQKQYKEYIKKTGKDVAFLKEFLKQFRLA